MLSVGSIPLAPNRGPEPTSRCAGPNTASFEGVDYAPRRMIDDHGPIIHDAVPVLVGRANMRGERIGKWMKLHLAGPGRSNMRVKVRIAR